MTNLPHQGNSFPSHREAAASVLRLLAESLNELEDGPQQRADMLQEQLDEATTFILYLADAIEAMRAEIGENKRIIHTLNIRLEHMAGWFGRDEDADSPTVPAVTAAEDTGKRVGAESIAPARHLAPTRTTNLPETRKGPKKAGKRLRPAADRL